MTQRHATDVVSLVFGTIFAGFTLVWIIALANGMDQHDAWWGGPVVLVVAGLAGLAASLHAVRTGARKDAAEPTSGGPPTER